MLIAERFTTLLGIRKKLFIGKANHKFSWDQKKLVDRESRSQLELGSGENY